MKQVFWLNSIIQFALLMGLWLLLSVHCDFSHISMGGSPLVVLILVTGLVFDRLDMFIDITMAYSILNFIGNIAIAKYLDTRERGFKWE